MSDGGPIADAQGSDRSVCVDPSLTLRALIHVFVFLPRIEAIIIPLCDDPPGAEFEEAGEAAAHPGAGRQRTGGARQRTRPAKLDGHALAIGERVKDLVAL